MRFPQIPSNPRGFVEFIAGADAFYRGQPRPRINPFDDGGFALYGFERRDGWDWADKMFGTFAKWEARHATVH